MKGVASSNEAVLFRRANPFERYKNLDIEGAGGLYLVFMVKTPSQSGGGGLILSSRERWM